MRLLGWVFGIGWLAAICYAFARVMVAIGSSTDRDIQAAAPFVVAGALTIMLLPKLMLSSRCKTKPARSRKNPR